MTDSNGYLYDATHRLDPLGDSERLEKDGARKNFAKVGSGRPSSLLYTYGPGALMDLPHFTVMPAGLDDWDAVWARRGGIPSVHAPRLLEVVRMMLGHQVDELRPYPWEPKPTLYSHEGRDLGVPARIFPQWMRCTGCDRLARLSVFEYKNTKPFQPHEAIFEHYPCHGRRGQVATKGSRRQPAVAARYLLACPNGHLDEFPYDWWVHEGQSCPAADVPVLKMRERSGGKGASAIIECESCKASRSMAEAQGEPGRAKLPRCRGRMPHLDDFSPGGCALQPRLMLVGASNLWFPAVQSIIDMPRLDPQQQLADDADRLRVALGDKLGKYAEHPEMIRDLLEGKMSLADVSDAQLTTLISLALQPPLSDEEQQKRWEDWEPTDLLVPEWRYLQRDPASDHHTDERSGLTLSKRDVADGMPSPVSRVLAVERLRKVNAVVGFTRIDELDRANDPDARLVPLTRTKHPRWTVATEDRGEGVFLQLDEDAVSAWEQRIGDSELWALHRLAHRRNFERRFSETAKQIDPDQRLQPPRYWLLHTLAHVLIRQMAMYSGYGAASLTERIYAWPSRGDERPAAAGLLICTTASDSDGTLGGLVRLSEPELLSHVLRRALHDATRCSSDPVCAMRTPKDPEDFLHGAACHCCVMASETSCERANRFLDRRFLLSLPGSSLGFFGRADEW